MVSTLIKEKPNLRFKEHNEEWKKEKLGKLVEISTGKKDTQNKVEDGLYPFFVRSQTIERINSFSFDGEAILTAGDGVGVGKVFHYINGKFDYHQRVYKLSSFSPSIHSWYLFEYFRLNFIREVTKYTAKTSVDSVRMEMLTEMVIKFPSIEEQTKIATFLSAIDEKIERQQRLLTLWQAYKKGIMQQIFSQKIRFKASNGQPFSDWHFFKLSDFLIESKKRNTKNIYLREDVLSVSGEFGIVNQIKLLGRSFAGESISNYHVVKTGDIVYTKSPLKSNPYGIIKVNKGNAGIVSTLYAVYNCKSIVNGVYLDYYFQLDDNTNNYLRPLVNKGAKNDMKINNSHVLSGNMWLPSIEEQTKIATFLSSLDGKIAHIERQLTSFREFKKGLLQQMFV